MRRLPLLAIAGLAVSVLAASAAYLESDGGTDSVPIEPPPQRIIPPPPSHGAALPGLVRRISVGAPVSRAGLTVYPLELGMGRGRRTGVLTLDEALRRDELAIRKRGR